MSCAFKSASHEITKIKQIQIKQQKKNHITFKDKKFSALLEGAKISHRESSNTIP